MEPINYNPPVLRTPTKRVFTVKYKFSELTEFDIHVTNLLNNGWSLHGSPITFDGRIVQMLYKETFNGYVNQHGDTNEWRTF